jgi:hypothetical protein
MTKKFIKLVVFAIQFSLLLLINVTNAETNHYEEARQACQKHDIEAAFIHLKNVLQQSERNLSAKLLVNLTNLTRTHF